MNQKINPHKSPESTEKSKDHSVPATVADNLAAGGKDLPEFGWKEHHRPNWALHSPIQDVFCRYGGYYS